MAHRRPTAVETHGDAKRLSIALGGFVYELTLDPRVGVLYDRWRTEHDEMTQQLEAMLTEFQPDPTKQNMPMTPAQSARANEFIDVTKSHERVVTADLLRPLLHRLPESWLPMLTENLLLAFRTAYRHNRTPPDQRPAKPYFGVGVKLTAAHKRGRVPNAPDTVHRNIRWLYRHYVPERRVSRRQLAREYAALVKREDPEECIKDVKDGIKQAWALLELGARSDWSPTVPGRIVVPRPDKVDPAP